jgi:hypothetical protein
LMDPGSSEARRHDLDGAGVAGRTSGFRGVFRYSDTREQEPLHVCLAEQARDEPVDERHPGRRHAEGVGGEVEPPFGQAGGELGLAVAAVGGGRDLGCGDDDERRILAESSCAGMPAELAAAGTAT